MYKKGKTNVLPKQARDSEGGESLSRSARKWLYDKRKKRGNVVK